MTSKSPVGDISVVTLIRTDTTLDHSQKAEEVCSKLSATLCERASHARAAIRKTARRIQIRETLNDNYKQAPHQILLEWGRGYDVYSNGLETARVRFSKPRVCSNGLGIIKRDLLK